MLCGSVENTVHCSQGGCSELRVGEAHLCTKEKVHIATDDDIQSVDSSGSYGLKGSDDASYTMSPEHQSWDASWICWGIQRLYGRRTLSKCSKRKSGLRLVEIRCTCPAPEDIGRKLKLEAAAYSTETGELLMHRVVKTDLVLGRAPDPAKRNLVTSKSGGGGGGARFRIITYNVLAEIYATQQQYPYCDFWALSWDYR